MSVSNVTYNSISVSVNVTSNVGISKYYYIIESEDLSSVSSYNSYTFNNLKHGTNYSIVILVRDNEGNLSNEYKLNVSTENLPLLANYIKESVYVSDGINGLYYHDGQGSYINADQESGDNSYRYSGANPNNYVCFGSDEEICPEDNLYRIIGVFGDEVKVIKSTSYGNYAWDSSGNNDWSISNVNNVLKTTYLNTITSEWQNKISNHNWKIGGLSYSNGTSTPQTAYNYEIGIYSINRTYASKIGLMYLSDYYYSAIPTNWSYFGFDNDGQDYRLSINNNWLYFGAAEWTITIFTDYNYAYVINKNGTTGMTVFGNSPHNIVRPCFYLTSDVTYISGAGTATDPIRIN